MDFERIGVWVLALSFGPGAFAPVCDVRATVCVVCRRGRARLPWCVRLSPLQFLLV